MSDCAARALLDAVKNGDDSQTQRILHRPDLARIAVTLAGWLTGPKPLEPCGTRSAAERHLANGDPLDPACADARRAYYRNRRRAQRAEQLREQELAGPDDPREWARAHGFDVGARGNLPAAVMAAYDARRWQESA